MFSTHILAFSSSRAGNSGYLETAFPFIREFLPKQLETIAFVPFASVDPNHEEYLSKVRDGLPGISQKIQLVTAENAKALIRHCDAIIVGGGNTFKLLHDIYQSGLVDLIREKVNAGTPYIGWSAGSNIAGRSISTTNDMPIIEPESFKALHLFPFQINPHYISQKADNHNGETRDQRLEEFVKMNPGIPVICLPEGTHLRQEAGSLIYTGELAGVIFETDGAAPVSKELLPGTDLSYLIKDSFS